MPHAMPRLLSGRILALAAATSLIGLGVLALASTDTLIDRSFAQAFANAYPSRQALINIADDKSTTTAIESTIGHDRVWLTRHDVLDTPITQIGTQIGAQVGTQGHARVGERITMAIDGSRPLDLEVIAVAELSAASAVANDAVAGTRLVMVTCREVARGDRPGRIVRVIVDADEPLTSIVNGAPARTL